MNINNQLFAKQVEKNSVVVKKRQDIVRKRIFPEGDKKEELFSYVKRLPFKPQTKKKPWVVRVLFFVRRHLLKTTIWDAIAIISLWFRMKIVRYGIDYLIKAYLFLVIVLSKRATKQEYKDRMKICDSCERKTKVKNKIYCGACGCGRWFMSELHRKNKYGNHCPLMKHPGQDDDVLSALPIALDTGCKKGVKA